MAAKNLYPELVKPRLDEIRDMRAGGATQNQIAAQLGISPNSLYKYALKYPELQEALDDGLKGQIEALAGALFILATGQAVRETQEVEIIKDKNGNIREQHEKKRREKIPPDKGAALNLLSNLTMKMRDGSLDHWLTDADQWDAKMKEIEQKNNFNNWVGFCTIQDDGNTNDSEIY